MNASIGPPGPWRFSARHSVGSFELRELALPEDVPLIHDWVRRDYARYWGMQQLSPAQVRETYAQILARPHVRALVGEFRPAGTDVTRPALLTECYLPIHEPVARFYDAAPSDRGLHILVAPRPERPISGFTRAAFATVLELLFADPETRRIVVEPDIRNYNIRAINRDFGFRELQTIELPAYLGAPAKTAMLSICTRADLHRALARRHACS